MTEATPQPTPPAPSKLIKQQGAMPCGCYVTEYADGTGQRSPCPPCGLLAAAQSLDGAARALAAVANRLRADQNQAVMQAAIAAGAGAKKLEP